MTAKMPAPTVLDGSHVRLEPLADAHVPDLFAVGGRDEEVWRWLPGPVPVSEEQMRVRVLDILARQPIDELVEARYRRFRDMGPFTEVDTRPVGPVVRPGFADRLRNWFDWSGLPSLPAAGRDEPPARDEV